MPATRNAQDAGFQRFVADLWPAAKARGVSRATFDEAFRGVEPDPKIVALTKKQSEFVRPIWEYINGAISAERLERGRQMASEWSENPRHDRERPMAFQARSCSASGAWKPISAASPASIYAVRALSTLAYTGYRGDFFKDELLAALQILQQGPYRPRPRCWAPGPAPWARPSSCLRAS